MSQLPAATGVGFKPEHFASITACKPSVGFFEVHAENYMGAGGLPHVQLSALRADYALSIHGVGLSIGGAQGLDESHLERLRILCDRHEPESFTRLADACRRSSAGRRHSQAGGRPPCPGMLNSSRRSAAP